MRLRKDAVNRTPGWGAGLATVSPHGRDVKRLVRPWQWCIGSGCGVGVGGPTQREGWAGGPPGRGSSVEPRGSVVVSRRGTLDTHGSIAQKTQLIIH